MNASRTSTRPLHRPAHVLRPVVLAVWTIVALVAALPGAVGAREVPPTPDDLLAPVAPAVLEALADAGTTDFWVEFAQQADLSGAHEITDWAERGQYVYDRLTSVAHATQAPLRAQLTGLGLARAGAAELESFWITNALLVRGGDRQALDVTRAQPGVAAVRAHETFEIPEPVEADTLAAVDAVEWGIASIGADQVWEQFAARGEGIVVGTIDTGVEYDHPALVEQYRGNLGGGSFDHNYNWWDPTNVCPPGFPCDNHNHGTHVTGTIAGDDRADNRIGVAPRAQWIAAKGCAANTCAEASLLAAGQFILAPTDLDGNDARPDLRPHVVNNSWGGPGGRTFYDATVAAWAAAGIFPVISNGNAGPSCGSAGSPADAPHAYAVGAYDIDDNIASFSSRGPGRDGEIKPDISAPGVNVRSSVRNHGYQSFNGTSMAGPHVAGAVALLWSAAPALIGDLEQTRSLLDGTAVDMENLTCGGDPGNNNVWGQGRLDIFSGVHESPRGPSGHLTGTVTEAGGGAALPDATLRVVIDGWPRTDRSASDGTYTIVNLPVGAHDVEVRAFGYAPQVAEVEIAEGETTTHDVELAAVPTHPVTGVVVDDRGNPPLAGATVIIEGTPLGPVTTGADGSYAFPAVPEGSYTMRVSAGCLASTTVDLTVTGPQTSDIELGLQRDGFGYTCRQEAADYVEGREPVAMQPTAPGGHSARVDLPFAFPFHGVTYNDHVYVMSTGYVNFYGLGAWGNNGPIPDPRLPDRVPTTAIYAFWDNVRLDDQTQVLTAEHGQPGARTFHVEWRDARVESAGTTPASRVDFAITLHEDGEIVLQYRNIDPDNDFERGGSATVGIENAGGTDGLQYAHNQPVLSDGIAIRFTPPAGTVSGVVRDGNDGQSLGGVSVTATAGEATSTAVTQDDGSYALVLPGAASTVAFSKPRYTGQTHAVEGGEGETATLDAELSTAAVELDRHELDASLPPGHQRTFTFRAGNAGALDLELQPSLLPGRGPGMASVRDGAPAPGTVLASWPLDEGGRAVGIGYAEDTVWAARLGASDGSEENRNQQYEPGGTPTGRELAPGWGNPYPTVWIRAMTYDALRGWMCQAGTRTDSTVYCWEAATGELQRSLRVPDLPVLAGLTHNADDDTFYVSAIGGISQVAGFSHPEPGAVLHTCTPQQSSLMDIAYHRAEDILWLQTATPTLGARFHQLNPRDCSTIATLTAPGTGVIVPSPGIALDRYGNLWTGTGAPTGMMYLVETGTPEFHDVTWLDAVLDTTGPVDPGGAVNLRVTVDTSDLQLGVHTAHVLLDTNAGRDPRLAIPVTIEVASDDMPPVTSATTDPPTPDGQQGWFRSDPVKVALSAVDADPASGVDYTEYRVDDGDWVRYDGALELDGDGRHELAYRSVDHAGNVEATQTSTVRIDATPPQLEVSGVTDGATYAPDGTLTVSWQATDATSGVDATSATLDGAPVTSGATIALDELGAGAHELVVTATDVAGNETVVSAGFDVTAPEPEPEPEPGPGRPQPVVRLSGAERLATAIALSQDGFADGAAGAVVLTRADAYADALAGTPLAIDRDGPLLLTHTHRLDERVEQEIARVLPAGGEVIVLGGTAAIHASVEQRLEQQGFAVRRISGATRFDTAVQVAREGLDDPDLLLVATGTDFPDALAAGAAAGHGGGAVLLTAGATMPAVTQAYIDSRGEAQRFALGGPAAQADPDAKALVGASRFETAVAAADEFFATPPVAGLATGSNFPDALAGGAHAGRLGGPVLLSSRSDLHPAARSWLAANPTVATAFVYGGSAALSAQVEASVHALLSAE